MKNSLTTVGRSLATLLPMAALLALPNMASAATDGREPFTVFASAGTVDEQSKDVFLLAENVATFQPNAPVGSQIVIRYNLTPQGNNPGGDFGFDSAGSSFHQLLRYRDNGSGFRLTTRIIEVRLTSDGFLLHNAFNSDDVGSTGFSGGSIVVDGESVNFDQNVNNFSSQSVFDLDANVDNDGAPEFQEARFGGSAFYLEVVMDKLSASGDGGFSGASIFQN